MSEIWKTVAGWEGIYEVSDLGRIKSLERQVSRGKFLVWVRQKILTCNASNSDGYRIVNLRKGCQNNVQLVHRIVAVAFVPNPDGKPQVNHKDHIKSNCAADNLEWVTNGENAKHSYTRADRKRRGSFGTRRKNGGLDAAKVRSIIKVSSLLSRREIAHLAGVDRATVANVLNGKSWKHVQRS